LNYKNKKFLEKPWSKVRVGDIVMVSKDREFPVDLLLLYAPKEIIYVDTMNLDGETNLKEKYVFAKDFNLPKILAMKGDIVCDLPNDNLDHWDGNLRFTRQRPINCK